MKYLNILIIFLLLVLMMPTKAQVPDEYIKQEQEVLKRYAKQKNEWMSQREKEYNAYVEKADREWADYLSKAWQSYQVYTGKSLPEKPKPKTIPSYAPSAKPVVIKQTPTIKPVEIPVTITPQPVPQPVEPIRKPTEIEKNIRVANISFYGRSFPIMYDAALSQCGISAISQENIGKFWENASTANYTPAIERLLQTKADLNINDYGYYLIARLFAKNLYPNDENNARLMTWFVLVRSGYGVRVAFQNTEVALLIPSLQQIYQVNFLTLKGIKYYVFPKMESANFYTYDKDYQSAGRAFDLSITSPINLGEKKSERALSFNFENKPYNINISYDPNLINFYKDYPFVDMSVYFNAAVSVQSKESMASALKPLVANMDEVKAVNFILRFVQTAFEYKTDPEQFGREKYFFAEEVLFYPFCDCEDRSVLFSYLTREILGLKVVGLEYPEHVATAVAFTSAVTGDYLMYQNSRYVVSDPTYINAPVGLAMPQYKTVSPIVYELNNQTAESTSVEKMWQIAEKAGCYKGSNRKNSKLLTDGSTLLTGYFANPVKLGTTSLSGTSNTHNCFVTKMNRKGEPIWANAISATNNAVGMSVETTSSGNVIVAGVFTGSIVVGDKSIVAKDGNSDLFVASYSPSGVLLWLNRGELETVSKDAGTSFSVIFDNNGTKRETKHAEQQLDERSQGLYVDEKGGIYYSGMTNNALALSGNDKSVAFASASSVDVIELLRIESEKYLAQKADRAIAGLFAAIRLVKFMGVSLTGLQTQQAIDKENPNFKKTCPNIYKNLGMINFVQNTKGVITIQTLNGKDISFDKVKVSNNSRISISELPSSDMKIDILSGIKVGKMVVWYNLNYIKMLMKNGNLLFDYDSDHSQATVNVRKDILN
jgi:hypothetical protein